MSAIGQKRTSARCGSGRCGVISKRNPVARIAGELTLVASGLAGGNATSLTVSLRKSSVVVRPSLPRASQGLAAPSDEDDFIRAEPPFADGRVTYGARVLGIDHEGKALFRPAAGHIQEAACLGAL